MAVVFISPQKRQQMFLIGIISAFALFVTIVALLVFLSQPEKVAPELVFNKPKVSINFESFTSDQFKNLQPFVEMQTQFDYSALTKDNNQVDGSIFAANIDEAKKNLQDMGLTITDIKQAEVGRLNPFAPYYQSAVIEEMTEETTKK